MSAIRPLELIRYDEYDAAMSEPATLPVRDAAPTEPRPTEYDWAHRIAYLRLLDAERSGADWQEVSRLVLKLDTERDPDRAHQIWESHLTRARWMVMQGYKSYLEGHRED